MFNTTKAFLFFLVVFLSTNIFAVGTNTTEMLSKVYQLSSEAIELGKAARGKLDDPRLRSYNDRLIGDNQVTVATLKDTASQLGIDLKKEKSSHKEFSGLKSLKGEAFQDKYLKSGIDINSQLLTLLQNKIIPATDSPIVKTIISNLVPRFSSLLDNAQTLQKQGDL